MTRRPHFPLPNTHGNGQIHRHAWFKSAHVSPRHVDVWLPPGYNEQPKMRYPVFYMHDGQNLFDPVLAFAGVDWGIDEAMTMLMHEHGLPGAIVVGVWNTPARRREYMPQKPLDTPALSPLRAQFIHEQGGAPLADAYLAFLVEELKPFIDAHYRTLPQQRHTFIMGSSMGGLISLYAICEYPHIFGGAACVSTHWTFGGEMLVDAMAAHLPDPATHTLYFDFGTETIDAPYEPFQRRMDTHLRHAGYEEGRNWVTAKFEGAEHSESAWRLRAYIPLGFLLSQFP